MTLTPDALAALAQDANLAPSVHNTQPTRWRLDGSSAVLVLEDTTRRLPIGDPAGRDAAVSHGAAIEGFVLACAAQDWGVSVTAADGPSEAGLRPVAKLTLTPDGQDDPLHRLTGVRRTYRGAFAKGADASVLDSLTTAGDVTLVRAADGVARLAELNDMASLRTFRDGAYRAELVSWMRLSRRHPGWALDGLNAQAMEMSGVEAAGAGLVLKPGVFEALDAISLARLFVAEAAVVRTASAIVLFHRPEGEDPLLTGRRFYRLWLEFSALGFSAAPMAVLADDEQARAQIARDFNLPAGRRLITAFRLGLAPKRDLPPKPRLPAAKLVV